MTKFEVVITAIIFKNDRVLITRRSFTKRLFPGLWTVPGGHLELSDFIGTPKDTADYWYNALERALRREVREEVGLEIKNISYVTSLAGIEEGKEPVIVLSCMADWKSGVVRLQEGETCDFAYIRLGDLDVTKPEDEEDPRPFALIDGIADEIKMAYLRRAGQYVENWNRF